MGCATSNLDDEEAVQICHDRKNFIKQAIEQRNKIVSGNAAYIHSLRRVSLALRSHAEEHHEFLHAFTASSIAPTKRFSLETILIPSHSNKVGRNQYEASISHMVNHSRAGASSSFSVEEWPESSETVRVESHYPTYQHLGSDNIFSMDDTTVNSPFFSSPYNRPVTSSQTPRWDFWDPFSSVDNYWNPPRSGSRDPRILKGDIDSLRKIREDEGIPELEEDDDNNHGEHVNSRLNDQTFRTRLKPLREPAPESRVNAERAEKEDGIGERRPSSNGRRDAAEMHKRVITEVNEDHAIAANKSNTREPHDFTVYLNRRPTNMREVMKDMENQFSLICDCVNEFSVMLELPRASNSSNSVEDSILNPFNLFFPSSSSTSRDDGHESSSNNLEGLNIVSRSHKSTLDRLYMWEKKLYQEVKSGERVRIAYERKCMQFRNQDVNGAEPSAVDKTRAAIRDLRTQLNVSVNAAEFVSKRIEILRDQELHPQLLELIRGLASMWRRIAECHRIQKRTADEAKIILFSASTAAAAATSGGPPPPPASRSAALLETGLRNWASCLSSWIHAQRSYARALAGWIRRCAPSPSEAVVSVAPSPLLTPSRSLGGPPPPVYGVCVRWSRLLDRVSEAAAVEGVEFFAAGVASVAENQRNEGAAPEQEAAAPVDAAAVIGNKVVCAGLAVAVGAAAEFAASSAAGYEELMKSLEGEGRRMAGRVRL